MSEAAYIDLISSFAALAGLPDHAASRETGALSCDGVDIQFACLKHIEPHAVAVYCELGPPAVEDSEARYNWMLQLNHLLLLIDGPLLALDPAGTEYLVALRPLDQTTPESLFDSVRACVAAAKSWRTGDMLPDFAAWKTGDAMFDAGATADRNALKKQQELLQMLSARIHPD